MLPCSPSLGPWPPGHPGIGQLLQRAAERVWCITRLQPHALAACTLRVCHNRQASMCDVIRGCCACHGAPHHDPTQGCITWDHQPPAAASHGSTPGPPHATTGTAHTRHRQQPPSYSHGKVQVDHTGAPAVASPSRSRGSHHGLHARRAPAVRAAPPQQHSQGAKVGLFCSNSAAAGPQGCC